MELLEKLLLVHIRTRQLFRSFDWEERDHLPLSCPSLFILLPLPQHKRQADFRLELVDERSPETDTVEHSRHNRQVKCHASDLHPLFLAHHKCKLADIDEFLREEECVLRIVEKHFCG